MGLRLISQSNRSRVKISQSISWADVSREASDHLTHLLALGTSAPGTWERPAARYMLGLFEREGIPAMLLPPVADAEIGQDSRPNLIAHIPGNPAEEPLLLLSHLDSAPYKRDEQDHTAATSGHIIRGPGALMGPVISVAQAMAMILLARNDNSLRRTVRYAAVSDGSCGRATGLAHLAGNHLEHITSDIAIAWGGISFNAPDGSPCSLLATAEKGILTIRLRAEGPGGVAGIVFRDHDPLEKLIRCLNKIDSLELPIKTSDASRSLLKSIASAFPDLIPDDILNDLEDDSEAASALTRLSELKNLDPGILSLIRSGIRTEKSLVRITTDSCPGLKPKLAEAEIFYSFPPGEDAERIAIRVLESIGREDGVFLAHKSIQLPSENEISPDVKAMIRAVMQEINPAAKLLDGLAPWSSGHGALRRFGTYIYGWEPFITAGTLYETLRLRGGPREKIDADDFLNSIKALFSFLCRAAL